MCMYVDAVHLRLSVNSSHCSSQEVQVNDANIVTSDVFTQNGIIHVVDKVCTQIRCCEMIQTIMLIHFCSFWSGRQSVFDSRLFDIARCWSHAHCRCFIRCGRAHWTANHASSSSVSTSRFDDYKHHSSSRSRSIITIDAAESLLWACFNGLLSRLILCIYM